MTKTEQITENLMLGWLNLETFAAKHNHVKKREIEKNGALYLLSEMLNDKQVCIENDEYNKPYLKNRSEFISISHSHKWLVIALNTKEEVGVDIEIIKETVNRIKTKFLTPFELSFAGSDLNKLTVLWAAKESIYKAYGKKNVDFKEHIAINDFNNLDEGNLIGKLKLPTLKKTYQLFYKQMEGYALTLVTKEMHD